VRGWLVATVLVLAMGAFSFGARTLQQSATASYLLASARVAAYAVPGELRRSYERKYAEIYRHWLDMLKSYKPEGEEPPKNPAGK
jgi:hypothetical protein